MSASAGSPAGRVGPALCVLSVLSPPNGSHRILQQDMTTESNSDFPCFSPEKVGVTTGKWYHEISPMSSGCCQAGYVIRGKFTCLQGRQNGVGDDTASWAMDGDSGKLYAAKTSTSDGGYKWSKGDVIGFALDADAGTLAWSINGAQKAQVNLKDNSSLYAPGDELVPAVSCTGRQGIRWAFAAGQLQHLPAGFQPLQAVDYPPEYALKPNADAPADASQADKLDDPALFSQLLASYAPTKNTPGYDKAAKDFAELRGGVWEYGMKWHLERIKSSVEELATKSFEGTLPHIKYNNSFARDVDAANEQFEKHRKSRRQLAQWTKFFLDVYGEEEGAKPVVDLLQEMNDTYTKCFVVGLEKHRYIAACDDRKGQKFAPYGIEYQMRGLQSLIDKDRSKMSASQLESHVADCTKEATTLRGWREWFVSTVGDIPFHTAQTDLLDAQFAAFDAMFDKKAMERDLLEKSLTKAQADLDNLIERGHRLIKEALAEFDRFWDRAQKKYEEMNEELTQLESAYSAAISASPDGTLDSAVVAKIGVAALAQDAKFLGWKGELAQATANWRRAENLRLLQREVDDEIRTIRGLIDQGNQMVYHSRVDEAQEALFQAQEKVAELKSRDSFLTLPCVPEFFAQYEKGKYELEQKIKAWRLDRETSDATRELNGNMTNVIQNLFGHYRNEEALEKYQEVKEQLKALESRKEWADIQIVKDCIRETKERGAKFVQDYKERVTTRQVEDAIRECSGALQTAKDLLDHHRHDECLVSLQKCKDLTEALAADGMLNSMPAASQWLSKYAEEYPALQRKHAQIMLDRAVAEAIRVADGEFSFLEGHFSHYRFEHALESLAKYRDLVKTMESETTFAGHPLIEEFLRKSDKAVPEFEKRYSETMLQREYDEAVRLADGELGTSNDLFSHHRYDEALVALHQYRSSIDAIKSREAFGAIPTRDAKVKEALEVKVPEWQVKYKETVLGRKGDDLARELSGLTGTAREHLNHHRHELFLAALQVLKEKANEAEPTSETPEGSDQRLMLELPQVKSALTQAYSDIHELSQKYDAEMLSRKIDEAIRTVDSAMGTAKDMLAHSRFDESLTAFSRARESEAELIAQNFTGSEKVDAHIKTFATEAKEFQTKYDTTMHERRLAEVKRTVGGTLQTGRDLFAHYRNEECLVQLRLTRDGIVNFLDEFPNEKSQAADWTKECDELEKQYRERVLTREADDAIGKARAEFGFCVDHLEHHRYENALASLALARSAGAVVTCETRFTGLPQVATFLSEWEGKLKEFTVKFNARMEEREAADKIRVLSGALGEMEGHHEHHRSESALEKFNQSKDLLANLEAQPGERFAARPEIQAAYADAEKRMAEFKRKYQERELSVKLRDSTSAALSALGEAENMLEHSRFTESLERASTARTLAGQVGADPILMGMPAVDTFLTEFGTRAEKLRVKFNETTRARAQADAKREAESALSTAQQLFEHHRHEESLVALNKARDFVNTFDAEFGRDAEGSAFVKSQAEQHAKFEKAYSEKVFQQEIDRKIGKAQSRLQTAKDAAQHHRYEEAMRVLLESEEAASLLAGDERFLKLAQIDDFLKQHSAATADLRKQIDATLKQRHAAEVARTARGLIEDALRLYEHHRYTEALVAAQKAREQVESDVAAEPSLASEAKEFAAQLKTFRERYQKEHLSREADGLIKAVASQLENGEFLLSHHRQEEALAALQRAKDAAATLGDDSRFDGLSQVDAFFKTWPGQVKKLSEGISEKILAKRAREAIDEARDALEAAKRYLDQHIHDTALEKLQLAVDKATALREDKDLSTLPAVVTFLGEFTSTRASLAARIGKEVFGREIADAIRSVKSHFAQAESMFSRYAEEQSLQAFSEARDAVRTVSEDERLAGAEEWKAFVDKEWTKQSAEFAKKYAEKVLGEEARTVAGAVRAHLLHANTFLDRGVKEKAQTALDEARSAAEPFLDASGMLGSLAVAQSTLVDLRATQKKFAETYLASSAAEAIATAKKHLALAQRAETRALDGTAEFQAAKDAVGELLGESAEKPVAEAYTPLPSVVDFLTKELIPAVTKAGVETFSASSGAAKGGKRGGKAADTPDGILGARLPNLAILRKGLPFIAIGTEVHPKFFTCLKDTNHAAKIIQREIKLLEANKNATLTIESAQRASKDKLRKYSPELKHGSGISLAACDDIDRWCISYGKALAQLQDELKDPKDQEEPILKQLATGFEQFKTAYSEAIVQLKKFSKMFQRMKAIEWCRGYIFDLQDLAHEYATFSQCPRDAENHNFMPDQNPLGLGHRDWTIPDCKLSLKVIEACRKTIALIQQWSTEAGGFPNQDALVKELNEWILQAKKVHVDHCIRQVQRQLRNGQKDAIGMYMEELRAFPLARAEAVKRAIAFLKYQNDYSSKKRSTEFKDPVQSSDEVDPDEKPEWYLEEFEFVTPSNSNSGLPFNKHPDSSTDSSIYTKQRSAAEGKILFSKTLIPDTLEGVKTEEKFSLEEATKGDGIFARACWKRALRNYALAKRRDNGQALYGPEGINGWIGRCQLFLCVKIDGKEITREDTQEHAFAHFLETGARGNDHNSSEKVPKYKPGSAVVDFWSYTQTCRFHVLRADAHLDDNMSTDWDQAAARFAYEFSKLASGDHKIEVELKFRLRPSEENWLAHPDSGRSFPFTTTPLSEPISSGSFTLVVPASKVPRRSVLPVTTPSLKHPAAGDEVLLREFLAKSKEWGQRTPQTEIPIKTAITSDFYESHFQHFKIGVDSRGVIIFQKEPTCFGRNFKAVLKRLKKDGWEEDQVAVFDLAGYGPQERNPKATLQPCSGLGVSGSYTFDLELLSEADAQLPK